MENLSHPPVRCEGRAFAGGSDTVIKREGGERQADRDASAPASHRSIDLLHLLVLDGVTVKLDCASGTLQTSDESQTTRSDLSRDARPCLSGSTSCRIGEDGWVVVMG